VDVDFERIKHCSLTMVFDPACRNGSILSPWMDAVVADDYFVTSAEKHLSNRCNSVGLERCTDLNLF